MKFPRMYPASRAYRNAEMKKRETRRKSGEGIIFRERTFPLLPVYERRSSEYQLQHFTTSRGTRMLRVHESLRRRSQCTIPIDERLRSPIVFSRRRVPRSHRALASRTESARILCEFWQNLRDCVSSHVAFARLLSERNSRSGTSTRSTIHARLPEALTRSLRA